VHGVVRDLELVVAAVVEFGPLQLGVGGDEAVATAVVVGDGNVLAGGGGGADGRAGEFCFGG